LQFHPSKRAKSRVRKGDRTKHEEVAEDEGQGREERQPKPQPRANEEKILNHCFLRFLLWAEAWVGNHTTESIKFQPRCRVRVRDHQPSIPRRSAGSRQSSAKEKVGLEHQVLKQGVMGLRFRCFPALRSSFDPLS
jgi:hypothetical protein